MLHLIINPTAGHGHAARIGTQITQSLQQMGLEHKVSYTESAGNAVALAHAAAEHGAQTVVAIGGDGTVSEVARGLYGTGAALAIIPAGTGNDMARMLGIPKKPVEALTFLLGHAPRRLDLGIINGTPYMNVCGTGFDVSVLDYTLIAKKYLHGTPAYLWGVIRTILSFKPVEVTFTIDGQGPTVQKLLILAVANGRYVGGGIDIAPRSQVNDGMLDLITVDGMPNWKMPSCLPKLLTGRILKIPGVRYVRCRSVSLASKGMRLNIDGEIVPMDSAEFAVLPDALMAHW